MQGQPVPSTALKVGVLNGPARDWGQGGTRHGTYEAENSGASSSRELFLEAVTSPVMRMQCLADKSDQASRATQLA
jgi:hypothetical protein